MLMKLQNEPGQTNMFCVNTEKRQILIVPTRV